jgi:hypothetical protein
MVVDVYAWFGWAVIAAEPHSVLPIGIVVLTPQSGVLPINNLRALASTAVSYLHWALSTTRLMHELIWT